MVFLGFGKRCCPRSMWAHSLWRNATSRSVRLMCPQITSRQSVHSWWRVAFKPPYTQQDGISFAQSWPQNCTIRGSFRARFLRSFPQYPTSITYEHVQRNWSVEIVKLQWRLLVEENWHLKKSQWRSATRGMWHRDPIVDPQQSFPIC